MGEIIPDDYKSYYLKGHNGILIILPIKELGAAGYGENWEGRKEKSPFLLEKSLRNLEKNKRKKVSDTQGFEQQNHLDLKCS